jgi:hypothetical protein
MIKKTSVLGLLVLLGTVPAAAQTVDCLVAVVNGQAVTLTDLQVAQEFGLFEAGSKPASGDPRLAVLEALIDRTVVLDAAREPVTVGSPDIEAALAAVKKAMGEAAFQAGLKKFGLREADLRPYLESRIRFEKVIATRFSATTPVSRGDVEKYYRDVYTAAQKARGLAPSPLADVRDGIESQLRAASRAEKIAEWVRSLRAQARIRINQDCLK